MPKEREASIDGRISVMAAGEIETRPSLDRAPSSKAIAVDRTTEKHLFATLDGLRGIAALAVVTFHYRHMLGPLVFPSAYLAVDLFFMISGIVIAHAYEHRLASGMTAVGFMGKRIVRLLPLYLAGLGVGAAVAILGLLLGVSAWNWAELLPVVLWGALMLPNIFPAPRADLYPLNIPCWSLFWEMVVNLAYVLALRRLRGRALIVVFVMAQITLAFAAQRAGGLDFGYRWQHPEIGLLRVIAGFSGGVLLARFFKAGRLWRLRLPPPMILIAAGALLALPASLGWAKDVACVALAFPLLCIAALGSEPRSAAPYLWLGTISYPLYVIHATLPWDRLAERLLHLAPEHFAPWSGLAATVGAVAAAWGLAHLYDTPVRRWVTGRIEARRIGSETVSARFLPPV
ncbi:Peptidoglycan/LPS O-acetylase OafA/YrhL, contains acyltransferase and SGNH-hydrolase domains [Novosphingobium sp. CF614]|uniref:acyltransferase family protein n=1 Tax=Novosphingobium sp. CF614 TaxID=1884364 RepID=UPI0008DF9A13|nr:acyltransferase [Novosphingobium sp. CF614]SFG20132.1 Peptidoglycan/LPS O-acetylase OafA/YrhL, contains acyltransferase and SGNH-hydrolase domains [Novosphingobium sp. CF614]